MGLMGATSLTGAASFAFGLRPGHELPGRNPVWVPRQAEAALKDFLSGPPGVVVMTGPQCAGKTYLVTKCLAKRPNVVKVMVCGSSKLAIYESLEAALGKHWQHQLDGKFAERPVIRVELERGASEDAMAETARCLVNLCTKDRNAYGIIVNGDEHATTSCDDELYGSGVIWVDYFNEDEMNTFFDKHNVLPIQGSPTDASRNLRRRIFHQVGANPQGLLNVVNDARRAVSSLQQDKTAALRAETDVVDDYIAKVKKRAETDVHMLFHGNANFRREFSMTRPTISGTNRFYRHDVINQAQDLLSKEYTRSLKTANDQLKDLVQALLRGDLDHRQDDLKSQCLESHRRDLLFWQANGHEIVTWNYQTKRFQFYTKAHENAAREYHQGRRIR